MNCFKFLLFIGCVACNSQSNTKVQISTIDSLLHFIRPHVITNSKEVRLGESNYYLQLPDNFKISEDSGKEGGLGYGITPKDVSSTSIGFVSIRNNNGINDPADTSSIDTTAKVFASSYFLNKVVKWNISKTITGYFEACTITTGNLNAWASSKRRNEIDSLISIIATLKEK